MYRNDIEPGKWINVTEKKYQDMILNAQRLSQLYSSLMPDSEIQKRILKMLLNYDLPEGLAILSPVYFDYGFNTLFGKNVFVNHGCYFMDGAKITIGNNVFIGPFCGLYTASHPLQYQERNSGIEKALPITIEDDCWLGANVSILQGVTLQRGCVVAAGSVVTQSFGPNSLIAGVPAKLIRLIDQNERLEGQ